MTYSQKNYPLRTKEDYESDALLGTEKEPENGLKGTIAISDILDLPKSIPIDYMHLTCLGLFKSILKHWFESTYHNKDFYIGKFLDSFLNLIRN